MKHGKHFVQDTSTKIPLILAEFHCSTLGGHSGIERTLKRISSIFWWHNMKKDVKEYVSNCLIFQQSKATNSKPLGLLMPLPIPSTVWEDISMDFITHLPRVDGKSVIMVVVDRFSKFCHLGSLPTEFNATMVAELFINMVVKLHGIPRSIVSYRDKVFTSKFWKAIHKASGTQLCMSSSYHPQTDGQTEVVNKCIGMYLRTTVFDNPRCWLKLLPWAELWYNTSHHSSLGMSPFQVLYGREPPKLPLYTSEDSTLDAVSADLQQRNEILMQVRENLERAQIRMKNKADQGRADFEFEIGD